MTKKDVIYSPERKDLVFVETESVTAWNIVATIMNSYSYTPEMGMDLSIENFEYNIDEDGISDGGALYTVLRADVGTQLAKFGLGMDEFIMTIEYDIVKIDVSVSRIGEVSKDAL